MEKKMFHGATPLIFQRARELRGNMTHAEKMLWKYLQTRPHGYKFRRQHPLGPFIADFYCHALQMVIEVDGSVHQQKEIIQSDIAKQWSIEAEGLKVLRFTNSDIIYSLKKVTLQIEVFIIKQNISPSGAGGNYAHRLPNLISPSGAAGTNHSPISIPLQGARGYVRHH